MNNSNSFMLWEREPGVGEPVLFISGIHQPMNHVTITDCEANRVSIPAADVPFLISSLTKLMERAGNNDR